MADTAASSELFSNIFGTSTQGLSIFSNNAFRRHKPTSSQVSGAELEGFASTMQNAASKESRKIRVSEAGHEVSKKIKKKKTFDQVSPEPVSSIFGANPRGSPRSVVRKMDNRERNSEHAIANDNTLRKGTISLHGSLEVATDKKPRQEVDSQEHAKNGAKSINAQNRVGHGKRPFRDAPEHQKPSKRQKVGRSDGSIAPMLSEIHAISKFPEAGSVTEKITMKRKVHDSPVAKHGMKRRKVEDSLECKYERKLRGSNNILTTNDDSGPASKIHEEETSRSKETIQDEQMPKRNGTGKRKRSEGDEHLTEDSPSKQFDTEEKLKRTIFVGNLPLKVKKKALIKEFSMYGPVQSVRLRSVPLLDTKIPRKGAIMKGQINEAVDSQHGYLVFEDIAFAKAALAHNMKEFHGKHLRVDAAHAPHQVRKGRVSLHYDPKRSIFVGNLPFNVKDEELYETFNNQKSPDMNVEAVRVVRDPHTSASKGIAYVLFKTKAGMLPFLSTRRKVKIRDRILRISRVKASQSMHKERSPKYAKRVDGIDSSELQKKRAKLSASYQGSRANKEKRKAVGRNDGQQHGGSRGTPKAGSKRKRREKHQGGISRSKKIRRT